MAINFVTSKLGTKISSNQVFADGYELQNLLLENLNPGCRVEYFVKPPIDIVFTFMCPIDIRFIVCELKVGEQKTNAFQVFVSKDEKEQKFTHQCSFIETNKDCACLTNTKYFQNHLMKKFVTQLPKFSSIDNCETIYVSRNHQPCFMNVKRLQLRLLKAQNSSVCCLKSVKIFGQPNHSVAKDKRIIEALTVYCKAKSEESRNEREAKGQKRPFEPDVEKGAANAEIEDLNIPEEFIDPITNEIMTIPMLLPSGKTLDKATLDKYLKNEAIWGRLPNDPFTNKAFTKDCEPILNNALKLRIDLFLSKNNETLSSHQLPTKRIVGGYSNTNKSCVLCKCVHQNDEQVYKLGCGHLICRQNIHILFDKQCLRCDKQINSSEVVRFFNNVPI
ncbi:RING finger protein 37-like protein [Dinothrombium tinctorium]|uniref:RING finger protein 37-like protein n=1 Tax=Dinothrombium tinctorium TaxID=1965070 RepID=A0A443QUX9_9ACAR|nr:RING finger protein 37-like protein [Dinothrombium tinctorium]